MEASCNCLIGGFLAGSLNNYRLDDYFLKNCRFAALSEKCRFGGFHKTIVLLISGEIIILGDSVKTAVLLVSNGAVVLGYS